MADLYEGLSEIRQDFSAPGFQLFYEGGEICFSSSNASCCDFRTSLHPDFNKWSNDYDEGHLSDEVRDWLKEEGLESLIPHVHEVDFVEYFDREKNN